jgi:hypothetical protein
MLCGSFMYILQLYVMLIKNMVALVVMPCGLIDRFQTVA